ncbi:MAG: FHA domain-containing protein [Burkholderiales bacterium]
MSKLVVSLDDAIVDQCFLSNELFSIGRGDGNTLKLDDSMISREHARITTVMEDHILADAGSANGTHVNGIKIEQHILQHGDVIELGRFRLKYVNPKVVHGAAFDRTMMTPSVNPADAKTAVETSVPARRAANEFPLGALITMNGAKAGEESSLSRVLFMLGIAEGQLAVINRRPMGYFITHVSGRRTPRVNGRAIGLEPHTLASNDVIEVGGSQFKFFLKV